MSLNGYQRILVLLTVPVAIGTAYSYLEDIPHYSAYPEDLMGGVSWVVGWWAFYFAVRWVRAGFRGESR